MKWKGKVIDKVYEKTKTLFKKTYLNYHKSLLRKSNPLNTLNDIHIYFVVTQIDKANGNVAFICQQFCALVLMKKLALGHNDTGTNKTYIPVHKTNNQVISDHTIFLRNK